MEVRVFRTLLQDKHANVCCKFSVAMFNKETVPLSLHPSNQMDIEPLFFRAGIRIVLREGMLYWNLKLFNDSWILI